MYEIDKVDELIGNQEVILRALRFYRDNQSFPKKEPYASLNIKDGNIVLC